MREAQLILLPEGKARTLACHYESALANAAELYIVSAYLTNWDSSIPLNSSCREFRFVIGRDFGITRKEACRDVMRWTPAELADCFVVADEIQGFHPKAMFWRDSRGKLHGLIGSSNLTVAAFSDNHEVNVYFEPSAAAFDKFKRWVNGIKPCVRVSEEWLASYQEAPRRSRGGSKKQRPASEELPEEIVGFELPNPKERRRQSEQGGNN